MPSNIIYSQQVFTKGVIKEASIVITNGIISDVLEGKHQRDNFEFVDYGNLVIFPGIIDAHIHINEPGRTEWEGFDTATKAAAAGGITTLVDMPLNSTPVTIDKKSFEIKADASQDQRHVHCGLYGGLVPANTDDIAELLDTGILGLKAFLTHSGLDDFPNVNESQLKKALRQLKGTGIPLLAHCEIDVQHAGIVEFEKNPFSYQHFLASRPSSWENEAVRLMINLCREFQTPVHIVHLSSAEVLPDILRAKEDGLPLTVETCPHYLFFNADDIPDSDTRYKCTPPIRSKSNNEKLWQALESGLIDFIASDHSPAPPGIKKIDSGNLWQAWGGIIGGQCLLSASWTKAKGRGINLEQLASWLCENPASFIGFHSTKGKIEKAYDADLVIWDPTQSVQLEEGDLYHKHTASPYVGNKLFGKIHATYCKGNRVYYDGEFDQMRTGELLTN